MSGIKRDHAEEILSLRSSIFELAALAIILAFGVNLISGYIGYIFEGKQTYILLVGLFLCLFSCLFIVSKIFPNLKRSNEFSGVQFFHEKDHGDEEPRELVEVSRYKYSEKGNDYFRALSSENKALMKVWKEGKFESRYEHREGGTVQIIPPAQRLQREHVEYFVLDALSLHLSTYFNDSGKDRNFLVEIGRNDMPSVLLDNRFLELFSKPMEDREAFSDRDDGVQRVDGASRTVVFAYGKDGEIYDKFELILPKGTKISKSDKSINIDTTRFTMKISSEFEGYSTFIPEEFVRFYIGKNWEDINPYVVRVCIEVRFKILSIFTRSGWDYYKWVDSFLEELGDIISFEKFLKNINWESALTSAMVNQKMIFSDSKKVGAQGKGLKAQD